MIAGGIEVNAPGLIYAQGLRMNHGPGPVVPGQAGVGNSTVSGTVGPAALPTPAALLLLLFPASVPSLAWTLSPVPLYRNACKARIHSSLGLLCMFCRSF